MDTVTRLELAPTGTLRAAINFGNTVLVRRNSSGAASGIVVDLATELARGAGVSLLLVTYETAGQVAASVTKDVWDIAFLAAEPERAQRMVFSSPYLEIATTCLVRPDSPLRDVSQIDREGIRIVVSAGSAYDLYLTRTLRHAQLVRAPSPLASAELFFSSRFEALAGIQPMLEEILRGRKEARLLEGRISSVQQAIASPRGRTAAATYLQAFVEEMKRSGSLGRILETNGVTGVSIPS